MRLSGAGRRGRLSSTARASCSRSSCSGRAKNSVGRGCTSGTSEKPAAITDKEANQILRRVEEGVDKPRPKVLFEPGEVVRVVDGPFNDFNGVVESVNYEKNRLQVAVQILGRSTPVELDFSQVEKA